MKKRIIGYYHVWLVNHYQEVVKEQIKCLVDSGLYEATEKIYIGCLGEYKNLLKLQEIIKPYSKIVVEEFSTDKKAFEFHTLNILKEHADQTTENYYLYYFHAKGLSFAKNDDEEAYAGGMHWRRSMDNWILTKWKDNIEMLDKGYETCGTQIRVRDFPKHYSGNYWYAKSEYIKLLPPVYSIDITNRMFGEFYIGMKEPIAATLSQEFIDYFTPPNPQARKKKKYMGVNFVHTLSWNTIAEVTEAVRQLYEMNDKKDFHHILVDCGFPLIEAGKIPNDIERVKRQNTESLKALAKKYGSDYLEIKNVGVSQNWSAVAKAIKIREEDVLISCDPDERVKTNNWVRAIGESIRGDRRIAVASLIMQEQINNNAFHKGNSIKRKVNGINVWEINGASMMAQIGISGRFICELGGSIPYPKEYEVYGNLESALIHYFGKNYCWVMLPDYIVKHPDHNPNEILRQWKDSIIHKRDTMDKQYTLEEFIKLKQEVQA